MVQKDFVAGKCVTPATMPVLTQDYSVTPLMAPCHELRQLRRARGQISYSRGGRELKPQAPYLSYASKIRNTRAEQFWPACDDLAIEANRRAPGKPCRWYAKGSPPA